MAKAQYEGQDVDCVRAANPNDPRFDPEINSPMLIINADGSKQVVPGDQVLLYAADDAAPADEGAAPAADELTPEAEAAMEADLAPPPKGKKK